jgi:hypothetical protein
MNEDLSAFFGDLSVTASVVVGTSTSSAQVYFDSPSMMALGGLAVMDAPSVVARHSPTAAPSRPDGKPQPAVATTPCSPAVAPAASSAAAPLPTC